jgi:hypothetical protein
MSQGSYGQHLPLRATGNLLNFSDESKGVGASRDTQLIETETEKETAFLQRARSQNTTLDSHVDSLWIGNEIRLRCRALASIAGSDGGLAQRDDTAWLDVVKLTSFAVIGAALDVS